MTRMTGPGAERTRAARATIRRLATLPPPSDSFDGQLLARRVPVGDQSELEAAVLVSPAHLVGVTEPPTPASQAAERYGAVREARVALEEALREGLPIDPERMRGLRATARATYSRVRTALLGEAAEEPLGVQPRGSTTRARAHRRSDTGENARPPVDEPPDASYDAVLGRAGALLRGPTGPTGLLDGGPVIAGSAFHDFTEYQLVRDPWSGIGVGAPGVSVPVSLELFLTHARQIIENAVWAHCWQEQELGAYHTRSFEPFFPGFVDSIYRLFLQYAAEPLYELQASLVEPFTGSSGDPMDDVLAAFDQWVSELCRTTPYNMDSIATSFDHPERWYRAADEIMTVFDTTYPDAEPSLFLPGERSDDYAFAPYPDLANFGLRVVWRQEWRPLGNQSTEVVRTIPLGPKQAEKIGIKKASARKATRTAEELTSTESTTESSTATKDSSEVVQEASSNFKMHAEAEAGGSFGPFSAKLSAGVSSEQSASSKDTKTRLNETMSKTASRMKRDVKIVVTTETTATDELTHTSEIANTNDEVAVTYIYSKLQRAYELRTSLAEVNSVVFVGEPLPRPSEITTSWIQRNSEVLRRVLLDPAHQTELEAIVADPDQLTLPEDSDGTFKSAAVRGREAIGGFGSSNVGYLPDFLASGQEAYSKWLESRRAEVAEQQRRAHRRAGLAAHIRRHILHYMRAIWADEDADQRRLRYSRRFVPTRWTFVWDGPAQPGYPVNGRFVPDYSPESMRPLSEVVAPMGPVGYAGNYSVFLLRGTPRLANMHEAVAALRAGFARFDVRAEMPAGLTLIDAVAHQPRYSFARYRLTHQANGWQGKLTAVGQTASDIDVGVVAEGHQLDFDGVRLWFDGVPGAGAAITVVIQITAELADPAVRGLKLSDPLPPRANEAGFFTRRVLANMASYLPEVLVSIGADPPAWDNLNNAQRQVVRANYHQFLLARDSTRRMVLDTNNVVLDLEIGDTPALEEFKRLHRYLDVLKELEERQRRQLENLRRRRRIAGDILSDPDIERLTVLAPNTAFPDLLGRDDAADDGAPVPP